MAISLVHLHLECFRYYYLFNNNKEFFNLNLGLIGCCKYRIKSASFANLKSSKR